MTYEEFSVAWLNKIIKIYRMPFFIDENHVWLKQEKMPTKFFQKINDASSTVDEFIYDLLNSDNYNGGYNIRITYSNMQLDIYDHKYQVHTREMDKIIFDFLDKNFETGVVMYARFRNIKSVEEFKKIYKDCKYMIDIINMQDTFEETGLSQMGILS